MQARLTEQSALFIAFTFAMFLGGLTLQIAGWLELLRKNSLGGKLIRVGQRPLRHNRVKDVGHCVLNGSFSVLSRRSQPLLKLVFSRFKLFFYLTQFLFCFCSVCVRQLWFLLHDCRCLRYHPCSRCVHKDA